MLHCRVVATQVLFESDATADEKEFIARHAFGNSHETMQAVYGHGSSQKALETFRKLVAPAEEAAERRQKTPDSWTDEEPAPAAAAGTTATAEDVSGAAGAPSAGGPSEGGEEEMSKEKMLFQMLAKKRAIKYRLGEGRIPKPIKASVEENNSCWEEEEEEEERDARPVRDPLLHVLNQQKELARQKYDTAAVYYESLRNQAGPKKILPKYSWKETSEILSKAREAAEQAYSHWQDVLDSIEKETTERKKYGKKIFSKEKGKRARIDSDGDSFFEGDEDYVGEGNE